MRIGSGCNLLGPLFPSQQPLFAGKTPLPAESYVRPFGRVPILAVGPETGPREGQHGGTANNPTEPDADCRSSAPSIGIPDALRKPGYRCDADCGSRRHFGRTRSGDAACANSGGAPWSASLRVRSRRVFVGRPAILGIILAADPDSGRGASST